MHIYIFFSFTKYKVGTIMNIKQYMQNLHKTPRPKKNTIKELRRNKNFHSKNTKSPNAHRRLMS